MRVLIAGLGSIGRRHGRNFKALGVDAITGFDPNAERRAQFAQETGCAVTDNFGSALMDIPDLVVVASPNRFHMDQALAAARAGCHLFIEKPLAISANDVNVLEALIEEKKLFAHVGSNWKFHPAFTTMKRLLDEGALGRVTGAQVIAGQWLPDWHPWEDYRQMYSSRRELGGGIVLDSHEFDYLTWLLGDPDKVKGMTVHSGALDIDTEDVAVACLRLKNNVLATVHVDYIQRDYRRRYHISGDQGTMEWDYTKGVIELYRAEDKSRETIAVHMENLNDMYLDQARHIWDGVQSHVRPVTSVAAARRVLDVLLKVKENHD